MTVLVAYASAHGSTKGVAQEIANRLTTAGVKSHLRAADDVDESDAYEAVILGSAIHNGRWLTPASELLHVVQRRTGRPLWLFSVCTIGETTSFLGPRLSRLARRSSRLPGDVAASGAPHRFFAGAIERSHWGRLGRLFFVLAGGTYGDHRDWADVDAWATNIALELTAHRSAA